jgi:endonuclease-3 related protein
VLDWKGNLIHSASDPGHARDILPAIFDVLHAHYGPQEWWPTRTGSKWEIMLGAVLTQRTTWTNVERSLDNLMAAWGPAGLAEPEIIFNAPEEELVGLLRPTGHFLSKPRKLKFLAEFVLGGGGVEALARSREGTKGLRARLLGLWGIGPETADAILLYAFSRPVFVADAYALRLASRWGLLPPTARYGDIQKLFMDNLPHEVALFNEYHALIVAHGKQICRPRALCEVCPLNRSVRLEHAGYWSCPRLYTGK